MGQWNVLQGPFGANLVLMYKQGIENDPNSARAKYSF